MGAVLDSSDGFYRHFAANYFPLTQEKRLVMLLFGTPTDYQAFSKARGAPDTPFGYYLKQKNIIVVNLKQGLGTATHELAHHFLAIGHMDHHLPWVSEGIPTFFEKFIGYVGDDGTLHISFGYFSNWRFPIVKTLIQDASLKELFKTDDQCLARSFMLFLHKKGHMKDFVQEVHRKGKEAVPEDTLVRVFGKPIDSIEREWKEWVLGQPIDENVNLIPAAFVKTESEWRAWWQENKDRLIWDANLEVYLVRTKTPSQQTSAGDAATRAAPEK